MSKFIFKEAYDCMSESSSDEETCPHASCVDHGKKKCKPAKIVSRYANFTLDLMEQRKQDKFRRLDGEDSDDMYEADGPGQVNGEEGCRSTNDFEKEMYAELSERLAYIRQRQEGASCDDDPLAGGAVTQYMVKRNKSCLNSLAGTNVDTGKKEIIQSDDVDDMETGGKYSGVDTEKLSNDDLFYDPNIDDENEEWVCEMRRKYQRLPSQGPLGGAAAGSAGKQKPARLSSSDAVLNCPGCMSLLCLDCQRHELYPSQYRAMFVTNCAVDYVAPPLHYPARGRRGRRGRKAPGKGAEDNIRQHLESGTDGAGESSHADDLYRAVTCQVCHTEVAVYDADEVYHFYNVLAGHA